MFSRMRSNIRTKEVSRSQLPAKKSIIRMSRSRFMSSTRESESRTRIFPNFSRRSSELTKKKTARLRERAWAWTSCKVSSRWWILGLKSLAFTAKARIFRLRSCRALSTGSQSAISKRLTKRQLILRSNITNFSPRQRQKSSWLTTLN